MNNNDVNNQKVLKKIDIIISLLENILILQSSKMGINKQEIRRIAGVAMNKVTDVTKSLKNPELSKE